MKNFLDAMDLCTANQNWYGALFIALSLPDICAKIDEPSAQGSQSRYCPWFDTYVGKKYIGFLSGKDCYALRCAYLHEGTDEITSQKARQMVSRFRFIAPAPRGNMMHCNLINDVLQLQVDIFCGDIKAAVEDWLKNIKDDKDKSEAVLNLMTIKFYGENESIGIDMNDYR
jgi:hypothetical protein